MKVFNIKFIGIITISLFFLCQTSFSQSPDWMSEGAIYQLKEMNLTYNNPNNFDEVIENEFFENNPALKDELWVGSNQLRSKDNRFIVFSKFNRNTMKNGNLLRIQRSIYHMDPKRRKIYLSDKIYTMYMDATTLASEEVAANWEDYINHYSKEETVNKFNAEKAVSYSIKLQPKDYYKGKYNNLWVLFLQKKYKGLKTFKAYKEFEEKRVNNFKKAELDKIKKLKEFKEKEVKELEEGLKEKGLKEKELREEELREEFKILRSLMAIKELRNERLKELEELREEELNEVEANKFVAFRERRGFVRVYCFYKDMSKRKLAKYKAEIEGIYRYED